MCNFLQIKCEKLKRYFWKGQVDRNATADM